MVLQPLASLLRRVPGLLQHVIAAAVALGTHNGVQKAVILGNVVMLSICAPPPANNAGAVPRPCPARPSR